MRPQVCRARAVSTPARWRNELLLVLVVTVRSGGDLDPGRLGLGDGAELLHHAERVKARPALGDLVVDDPVDRDPGDLHRLARGRHAHQLAVLRAGASPAGDNAVALGNLLVHDETAVRKGG